jgi:hypothetical protein
MKKWIYIIIVLFLSGCWPCDTIMVENGPLPDSALGYVPYKNGGTYSFRHSNGLVINYNTTRETLEAWSGCSECCKYEYHYEVNSTRLVPDYPVFTLQFQIDNQDTLNFHCHASIGKYGFYVPTNNEFGIGNFEKFDSVKVDSEYYYQVFKLKSNHDNYYFQDSIYVDSMYYNYENGIIKILLSNGENYTIHE